MGKVDEMHAIYFELYDPDIETDKYNKDAICTWVRAVIHSAINRGYALGAKHMKEEIINDLSQMPK